MKDDLSKCNQWEVAVAVKLKLMMEKKLYETAPEPISAPTAAEPSDDVFPTIPPEELSETVQNLAILEEKKKV